MIIYTSGTTSKPKGVMLTHAALCAQVDISAAIFPVDGGDTFLSVLPLSHTYECSIGMIYPFSMGARVVYLDRPPTASVLMPALRAIRPDSHADRAADHRENLPPPGARQVQFQLASGARSTASASCAATSTASRAGN